MATITGSAAEPQTTITAPSVGDHVDAWGDILNNTTLKALLDYALWLKARSVPDPASEANGRMLEVQAGALTYRDAPSGGGGDIALADGYVIVVHNGDSTVTRPAAARVEWEGWVEPGNAIDFDVWAVSEEPAP
jgi:hypothetical protein